MKYPLPTKGRALWTALGTQGSRHTEPCPHLASGLRTRCRASSGEALGSFRGCHILKAWETGRATWGGHGQHREAAAPTAQCPVGIHMAWPSPESRWPPCSGYLNAPDSVPSGEKRDHAVPQRCHAMSESPCVDQPHQCPVRCQGASDGTSSVDGAGAPAVGVALSVQGCVQSSRPQHTQGRHSVR